MEHALSYRDNIGNKIWYLPSKGKDHYHRPDGPAVKWRDGSKWWFVDDNLHRLDGPAMEEAGGRKEWWINGKNLPTEEVEEWIKENDVDLKTSEGQMAFKLAWT